MHPTSLYASLMAGSLAMVLALGATGGASAAGISVRAPAGYTVKQIAKDGSYVTEYEVSSAADPDSGCQVGFQPTQRTGKVTQAELNSAAAKPDYLATVKRSLALVFATVDVSPFEAQGVAGAVAVGEPKGANGAARLFLVILETPEGRANVSCAAPPAHFDAVRHSFEAITKGVSVSS